MAPLERKRSNTSSPSAPPPRSTGFGSLTNASTAFGQEATQSEQISLEGNPPHRKGKRAQVLLALRGHFHIDSEGIDFNGATLCLLRGLSPNSKMINPTRSYCSRRCPLGYTARGREE